MNKQKLLILVDWFYPGYKAGGPIQSSVNLSLALKDYYDVSVLTTDTDFGEQLPYDTIISEKWVTVLDTKISVYYLQKSILKAKGLKKKILDSNADYVYLNHLFSPLFVVYPLWLKFTRKLKTKIVLCPRGALYDSALSVKAFKKKIFIKVFKLLGFHKMVTFHATNEREKNVIDKFFPGSKIFIANNLVKMQQPPYRQSDKARGAVKCIFISRIVPIKNLLYFLEVLETVCARVYLSIVGPLEDEGYWEACLKMISQLPVNIQVTYNGPVQNDQLSSLLQEHHLFVLPTTGENFGHSIFEAFLAGRPVLISNQTPWLNLAEEKVGWDLSLDTPGAFKNVIEEVANWDQDKFDEWSKASHGYAAAFIKRQDHLEPYLQLFHD